MSTRRISESPRLSLQEEVPISRPRFDPRQRVQTGPRTNERIRIPEVRVIGAEGEMLGVMETRDALRIAREKDLDLVEVNPKAFPPVCKIMDFGKFKYEESKKTREAKKKQTVVKLKEIKLRPKTDDHDIDFKVKHIRNFIAAGDKVKITVRFRGREITHPETAQRQFETILDRVKDVAIVESSSRMEGRAMIVLLAPRPAGSKGGPPLPAARAQTTVQPRREQAPVEVVAPEVDDDEDDDDDDAPDDAEAAEAAEVEAAASVPPPPAAPAAANAAAAPAAAAASVPAAAAASVPAAAAPAAAPVAAAAPAAAPTPTAEPAAPAAKPKPARTGTTKKK